MKKKKSEYVCPECKTIMEYADENILSCPNCNCWIEEDEYYSSLEEEVPEYCQICGGPHPQCTTSCSLYDD